MDTKHFPENSKSCLQHPQHTHGNNNHQFKFRGALPFSISLPTLGDIWKIIWISYSKHLASKMKVTRDWHAMKVLPVSALELCQLPWWDLRESASTSVMIYDFCDWDWPGNLGLPYWLDLWSCTAFGYKMRIGIWKTSVYSVNEHIINQVSWAVNPFINSNPFSHE